MAEWGQQIVYTLTAAVDCSAYDIQYRGVIVGSAAANAGARFEVCSQAGDAVVGILQSKPEAETEGRICFHGISKAMAGGTIAATDIVRVDAKGSFVKGNSGYVAGYALTGVASGGVFTLVVQPGQATA